jgi:hypothetical protein
MRDDSMQFVEVEHPAIGRTSVAATAVQHLGEGWTVIDAKVDADGIPVETHFDPSLHTVAEVLEHLTYATPEERDRVLAAELDGKARAGIVGA